MTKKKFFELCDSALYGESEYGTMGLEVMVRSDPYVQISTDFSIYLRGWFRGTSYRFVESVNQRDWKTSKDRCKAKLPKYERWLTEWKTMNPGQQYVLCDDCNGPLPKCWC